MSVEYNNPPDYESEEPEATSPTSEQATSSDTFDECPWKKTKFDEGDHHADDVDHVADDIL